MFRTLSRRGLLIGAALLPAACSTGTEKHIYPSSQILPEDELALTPTEGMVVGVAAYSQKDVPWADAALSRHSDRKLIMAHESGLRRDLTIVPVADDDIQTEEYGATLYLRPFAMRLPAGRWTFIGTALQGAVMPSTMYLSNKGATAFSGPAAWLMSRTPRCEFDVVPGQVRYIGTLGILKRSFEFGSRDERDAACNSGDRAGARLCTFDEVFLGTDPVRDLALVRQRFPKLVQREIQIGLAQTPGDHWRRWPQMLASAPRMDTVPPLVPITPASARP